MSGRWHPAATSFSTISINRRAVLSSCSDPHEHDLPLAPALGVPRLLKLNDVLRLLRSEVERAGSQRAFARKAGVNVSVVSKTLRRMVLPSQKILSALNLRVAYLSKCRRLIALVGTWRRRVGGRRELALMSDRSLRDIGLTRYDAFQEIRRPFWRP